MLNARNDDVLVGSLCAIGCEVLYGLSYVFTKQATVHASALSLLGWRFLLAFLVMSLLIGVRVLKVEFRGKSLKPLLAVAVLSPVIYFIGETVGIRHTTASESGVFLACIPVVSLVASTLILRQKPTRLQVTGIVMTLVGVLATVLAVNASSSLSLVGYAFLALAVIAYALYCVFVEKASAYTGVEITYAMLVAGAAVFSVLAISEAMRDGSIHTVLTLPFRDRSFLTAVLYQGVGCSVCAFFLSNVALARIGVNRTSSFVGVSTVVALAAGAVFAKESVSLYQLIGAGIVIAGVYTANSKKA